MGLVRVSEDGAGNLSEMVSESIPAGEDMTIVRDFVLLSGGITFGNGLVNLFYGDLLKGGIIYILIGLSLCILIIGSDIE